MHWQLVCWYVEWVVKPSSKCQQWHHDPAVSPGYSSPIPEELPVRVPQCPAKIAQHKVFISLQVMAYTIVAAHVHMG
jgi:hypothetical protein